MRQLGELAGHLFRAKGLEVLGSGGIGLGWWGVVR